MLASVPKLVRAQPESIAALARSYYHIGKTGDARIWLKELQNHPGGAPAVMLGAEIADEMGDYETAESLLVSAGANLSDQTTLKYRIALVKFHGQHFEASEHLLQQLLAEGHTSGDIYRLLGWCRERQQQVQDAIHAFQEAIKLEPTNETSYLDLGNVLLIEHRMVPALELTKRTAAAFPDSPRAFLLKGWVELAAVHFTDALESFSHAGELDPSSTDARIGLARAQMGAGMAEQAKKTLENAIRELPKKAPFEVELAGLLLKEAETGGQDAQSKAERLLNSAVTHDSNLAEAHYQLGELALQRGQAARALTNLEMAAKLEPGSARIHFALSSAYRRLGQPEKAAEQAALYERLKEKETPRATHDSPDGPANN
jgi:Tfp pilus assembly protein PilF